MAMLPIRNFPLRPTEDMHDVLTIDTLDAITIMAELSHRDPTLTVVTYWLAGPHDEIQRHVQCLDCMLRMLPRRMPGPVVEHVTKMVQANVLCIEAFTDMPPEFQCPRCRASLVARNPEWRNVFDPL